MKIIAVVSQKGGVGKTTVSQVLSVEALNQGFAAALIDTDPQKSATEWGDQRTAAGIEAPTVITTAGQGLRSILNELEQRGAAIVFIDTPPHSNPAINAALEVATGAVLVTRPNPMDLSALARTWQIVQALDKPAATILTQTTPGNRARALALAHGFLDELRVPFCPMPLTNTLSYPYAQAEALTVQEREPTSKARAEIAEVWGWFRRQAIF